MFALLTTVDPVKLGAVRALLTQEGVASEVFDAAAGALWTKVIPMRLMISEGEADTARRILREARFVEAADGDWDLK
jgi:hypothetical protein